MKRFLITLAACTATLLPAAGPALAQGSQGSPDKARAMFEKVDTNHDGMLSAEEWTAAGRRAKGFEMVDANHDGQITPDELRAAAAKRGQ
jgi:Ca2+-binding EF-hand superfamily protein